VNQRILTYDGKVSIIKVETTKALQTGITLHEQSWEFFLDGRAPRLLEVFVFLSYEPSIHFRGKP